MVTIVREAREMSSLLTQRRRRGQTIGLVPTMGYLHEGHLSLVRSSRMENDVSVVSLFVNPLQFGPGEDLSRYPRNEARDRELLDGEGVDFLFAPAAETLYAPDHSTFVDEAALSLPLCGASRPGHFRGVCTVVLKLFNIVGPDRAYFGMKDYQQLQVIRRMVRDLSVPVTIRGCPLVREPDGLALSSRNTYLSPQERTSALALSSALEATARAYADGERSVPALLEGLRGRLTRDPLLQIDYAEIRDAESLEALDVVEAPAVVALAVRVGKTRLIDNAVIGG
ncbi:pantoate--beta-alanine ligase [Aminithiophilus ramosus]|uniref:Pantothenate synthetase n=2 Tax=Synergistales TaxID=649776 RepID=A0A9Q7ANK4_9BACT|nr:pantoate--beta-alanine ligase [Aminithiophilus ramosus]QTX32578.1 pantoate--beta-alanine ligase [Aminithiophilus ramosus]QVL36458.1 pantoate--beta-alanine ligase [Synergistota bacterium]